jgi:hypothetical protein
MFPSPRRFASPLTLAALGGAAILGTTSSARAESTVAISPSLMFNVSFGQKVAFGLGLDLRVTPLLDGVVSPCDPKSRHGLGGFGQVTWLISQRAARFALGVHGGGEVLSQQIAADGELGWTYRTRIDVETSGQHGLHLGALGLFTLPAIPVIPSLEVPVRVVIPLSGGPLRTPEVIVGLGARVPAMFGFPRTCIEGRPLRTAGGVLLPGVVAGRERRRRAPRLDGATRSALADAWIDDARAECASIPAFVALARDLAAVGAAPSLVAHALAAAGDEVRHTLLCRELAADLAGIDVEPLVLAPPPATDADGRDALLRLALEAWFDGCLGEGAAADRAARARVAAGDPATRAALGAVTRDEARHAELGWAVLDHCLAAGGSEVSDALAQAVEAPETEPPRGDPPRDADPTALRAHGRLAQRDVDRSWRDTTAGARHRASALLSAR